MSADHPQASGPLDPAPPPPPGVYRVTQVARAIPDLGAWDAAQVCAFRERGYVAVERFLSAQQVASAGAALADLIMGRVPGFTDIEFEARFRNRPESPGLDERQDAVRKLMHFTTHEPRLAAVAQDPRLLPILAELLGAPPRMFQDMALLKPPHGREKPWHQDNAYFRFPVPTPVVGVWIALDEATVANGCMHVLGGGHHQGPQVHIQRRDWQLCDTDILGRTITALPISPCGCIIFNVLLPHGTPPNPTPLRRRALQFHYAPAGVPEGTDEDRLAVFGAEGKGASC